MTLFKTIDNRKLNRLVAPLYPWQGLDASRDKRDKGAMTPDSIQYTIYNTTYWTSLQISIQTTSVADF